MIDIFTGSRDLRLVCRTPADRPSQSFSFPATDSFMMISRSFGPSRFDRSFVRCCGLLCALLISAAGCDRSGGTLTPSTAPTLQMKIGDRTLTLANEDPSDMERFTLRESWPSDADGRIIQLARPTRVSAMARRLADPHDALYLDAQGRVVHAFANVPPDVTDITINERTFAMELAVDDSTRLQGLSDRNEIAEDGGMIFVFTDSAPRQFVMRRCLVPIDIAYLNDRGAVIALHEMTVESPDTAERDLKRYPSSGPARYVLEFRAGTLRALNLQPGTVIDLDHEALAELAGGKFRGRYAASMVIELPAGTLPTPLPESGTLIEVK